MNWQRYFRTVQYAHPRLAQQNSAFCLVESNRSGQWLLYFWDSFRSTLEPLGPVSAMPFYEIAPDGRSLFYLQDTQGNDFGHMVCIPTAGGEIIDLTPDLPPYNAYAVILCQRAERAGFT